MRTTRLAIVAVSAVLGAVCLEMTGLCGASASDSRGLLHTLTFDSASAFAMSADGEAIAVGGGTAVVLVDGSQWTVTRALAMTSGVVAVALSPDGRLVAAGLYDDTIGVWEVSSGAQVASLAGRPKLAAGLAFSPDGRFLASTTTGLEVKLWSVGSWRQVRTLSGLSLPGNCLAFSPESRLIAAAFPGIYPPASWKETVAVWDVETGQRLRLLQRSAIGGYALSFSPDGRYLCTDDTLWDTRSGQVLYTHWVPNSSTAWVSFLPDGTLFATAGADGVVRLWQAATGYEVTAFEGHAGAVVFVQFTPDGRYIVSGGLDGTLRVWAVSGRAP